MAQTLYINRAWADGKTSNDPFPEGIDIVLNTNGFADSHFVTTPTTDTVWFAACDANNAYSELDLTRETDTVVTLSMRPCTYGGNTYDTAYIYMLDNDDALEISSGSKFTFGSVVNESGESITISGSTISGSKTVFKVEGISASSGWVDNKGHLFVSNGAQFSAWTFTNENSLDSEHPDSVLISGQGTEFTVTGSSNSVFTNKGELSVSAKAMFTADKFVNSSEGKHTVAITGSTFNVGDFDNYGELSVTEGSIVEANTFENESTHNVTINGSTFSVTTDFDNTGNLYIMNGSTVSTTKFENDGDHKVTISDSTFTVSGSAAPIDFYSNGELSITNSTITVNGTFKNDDSKVEIIGGTFSVKDSLDNVGSFSATNGATVSAGSFESSSGTPVTISGEGTSFTTKSFNIAFGIVNIESGATVDVTGPTTGTTVNGTLNISGEGTSFTTKSLFNNGSITIVGGSTVNAGEFEMNGGKNIKITDSTFTADSIKMGHEGLSTITMNFDSSVITGGFDFPSWAQPTVKYINVEVEGFSGTQKIIDVNSATSTPLLDHILLTGTGSENIRVISIDGDISITSESGDILYVNSAWSGHSQGDKVGESRRGTTVENLSFGNNAFAIVNEAVTKEITPPSNKKIMVVGGSYGTSNAPTFDGIDTTIQDGTFDTSVCGGFFNSEAGTETSTEKSISLSITGGTFNRIVFAGDREQGENCEMTRTGDITMTISGGTFYNAVAGAMAVTTESTHTSSELNGNVNLTIRGGTFNNVNNKGFIYGGSIATKKPVGGKTTINGNVTVTLDATNNNITIANLVVGSFGAGKIGTEANKKDAKLVLTGTNDITATGEIWGGCSSDIITNTKIEGAGNNRYVESTVSGRRILSFTGFEGTLTANTNKIRAFSDVELKNSSSAKLGGCANLSDVVNWTFEKGSSLTGDFINDFNGDTLNLTEFTAGTFDLMFDSNASNTNDIFNGFGALADIQMNGTSTGAKYNEGTQTWAWGSNSLAIVSGESTKLTLTIIA